MEEFLDHWLWREEYWLPPGVTWRDMVGTGDTRYPLPRDLLFSLSLSLIFIGVRYIFESWRFTFYSAAFLAGLMVLIDSSVCVQDFKEQIIHHVATIVLIGFSYCSNYIRVGTLVMLVHDASDYLLESAKMFNYAGWKRTCDTLFVIFSAVFLFTRLVVFPIKIIHTTLYLSMEVFEPFFGYYFFNVLLLVLQVLHIFWASLILRMVWKFVFEGKVDQDERSDVEETDFAEDEEEKKPWDARNRALDSKLVSLANNNCVLNNLTSQRNNTLSTLPKAR
ncbi:CERS2 synthase, partial [Polypterus senegalus]